MSPWANHRRRAEVLRERYPFAAEVLTLYLALLEVWELAGTEPPERVVPQVVKATEAAGPEPLAGAVRELYEAGGADQAMAAWLAGRDLPEVERFLARASLRPASVPAAPGLARHCPHCGGPPQLSVRGESGENLVSGQRSLMCARCWRSWSFSASTCPSCGESAGARRTVYAEPHGGPVVGREAAPSDSSAATFPHLRVDACDTCRRYLIDVDLGRDARAVPEVDELAAMPLDLYATEQGLTKITPNLMGL